VGMDARNAFDVKIGALPRPCVQCTLIGTDVTLGQFQTRTRAQNVRQGTRQRWRKKSGHGKVYNARQGVRKRWRKLLVTEKMHAPEADCRLATVLHGSYMRAQGLKMIARVRAIT